MNTETHHDTTQDTTLTAPSGHTPDTTGPRRKRNAKRKNANTAHAMPGTARAGNTSGFKVPVGDSGEVVQSAWHFGG